MSHTILLLTKVIKVNGDSNKVVNEAKWQYSSLIDLARVMGKHVDYSAILTIKSKLNIPDESEVFFTAQVSPILYSMLVTRDTVTVTMVIGGEARQVPAYRTADRRCQGTSLLCVY